MLRTVGNCEKGVLWIRRNGIQYSLPWRIEGGGVDWVVYFKKATDLVPPLSKVQ
jgi:hypothetical protein